MSRLVPPRWLASALATAALALTPFGGSAQTPTTDTGETAQPFVIYTQYSPTFVPGKSRVHFAAVAFIQNTTSTKFKNLLIERSFPEGFKVEIAPTEYDELERRPPEQRPRIENNTYKLAVPELWGRRGTLILYQLSFTGRPGETVFRGMDISYEEEGGRVKVHTPDEMLDLKTYSNFSGPLRDFLKRNAEVEVNVGVKGAPWALAPIDFKGIGQNPVGITGVSGDISKGHFRIQSGLPGTYKDLLVVWWPIPKDRRVQEEQAFRAKVKEFSTWVGLRTLIDESIKVVPGHPFKHFKGWRAEGQWKDDIPERFGEGPFAAALFYSPARDAEFMIFWWAQGRGVGRGRGDVPQPEKDAALMRELEEIVNTIRPFRKA